MGIITAGPELDLDESLWKRKLKASRKSRLSNVEGRLRGGNRLPGPEELDKTGGGCKASPGGIGEVFKTGLKARTLSGHAFLAEHVCGVQ